MDFNLFTQNICEIDIIYTNPVPVKDRPLVTSSQSAVDAFRSIWDGIDYLESAYVLLMNRANHCLGISCISKGGISGTVIDPKVIFQRALKANASALIIAHNHPSGRCTPSAPDRTITEKLVKGGKVLDINVLDHVILTSETFYSFADSGEM